MLKKKVEGLWTHNSSLVYYKTTDTIYKILIPKSFYFFFSETKCPQSPCLLSPYYNLTPRLLDAQVRRSNNPDHGQCHGATPKVVEPSVKI